MYDELTEVDIKKMQEEIDHRVRVLRPQLIEEVQTARAFGDLSENFEYKCAKQAKNRNESRIRYLERMLKTAHIVSDVSRDGEVGLNNIVEVYFEDDDETETYKIVTSIRGNSMSGKISIESPMGKALLGKKEGDRVYVKVNENTGYYVVIRSVKNTTEDADDKIRGF